MTFTEAAAEVLRLVGKPLHYKEITDLAIEKNLLSHVGKSPEVTMGARLAALLKKSSKDNPLVRVKPGVFALREWDEDTIKAAMSEKTAASAPAARAASSEEGAAPEHAKEERTAGEADDLPEWEEEEESEQAPDELRRAEIAASGAELFGEEEDDDQPILGGADSVPPGPASADGGATGQRRRRRRRRGRGRTAEASFSGGGLPSYTVTPAFGEGPARTPSEEPEPAPIPVRAPVAPEVISVSEGPGLDELAGRELADAVAFWLNTLDRNGGQVSLRQLAEAAQRRGRLTGDMQQVQSQIAACIRADNARRLTAGQRMRFRFSGGKVALTDWLLGGELARLEAEANAAVERYREASRRAFLRKLQELPGHALVELTLLVLDRIGISQIRPVRRPGTSGAEAHLSGVQKSSYGEIKTAIIIRKDGREIGRERVTDLRGSLHHYGPATSGFMLTTGQVLSGAREESATPNASPIALCDGIGLARLCEENEVAVVRARMPIALPDVDMLEALRAS
jgi:restriction endonuclease Mrr/ribosomal protein L12E/L44/L45/RPP1/RPP2